MATTARFLTQNPPISIYWGGGVRVNCRNDARFLNRRAGSASISYRIVSEKHYVFLFAVFCLGLRKLGALTADGRFSEYSSKYRTVLIATCIVRGQN